MERRLAVHAGAHRQAVSARTVAAVAAVVFATTPALAAPKGGEARAQFDQGVAAYTRGDYDAAAEALGASFVLEADPETLFAWAQTERKRGHCDRAIDLYAKLLDMDLPAENKQAVRTQIDECRAIIAQEGPKPDAPRPAAPSSAVETPPLAPEPAATQPMPPSRSEGRAWWRDPVGGALVGVGAVGVGLGAVFLVQGRAADRDKESAASYADYEALASRAESRGRLGVIGLAAGGALIAGGVVLYLTRKPSEPALTTLVVPSGGGLALSGRF